MNESLDDVRRDIENTRVALGVKISRLENKIETTASTTLNPAYHVKTRPWPTLGVFALLGWFVGRSLKSKSASKQSSIDHRSNALGGLASSVALGAANVVGVVAGDWVRDFLKDRRKRRSP
jgi:hypothetical protein